jgi:hypothetical protein
MRVIDVAELRPDMILAEDLSNLDGRFLLAKGTRLTSKHLQIIKMWGVVEANVGRISRKNVEGNTIAQLHPELAEKVKKVIGDHFNMLTWNINLCGDYIASAACDMHAKHPVQETRKTMSSQTNPKRWQIRPGSRKMLYRV